MTYLRVNPTKYVEELRHRIQKASLRSKWMEEKPMFFIGKLNNVNNLITYLNFSTDQCNPNNVLTGYFVELGKFN